MRIVIIMLFLTIIMSAQQKMESYRFIKNMEWKEISEVRVFFDYSGDSTKIKVYNENDVHLYEVISCKKDLEKIEYILKEKETVIKMLKYNNRSYGIIIVFKDNEYIQLN